MDNPGIPVGRVAAGRSRRRPLLSLAFIGALAAPSLARAARTTLRIGDQVGGARAVAEAAGVLGDLPYTLEWAQFPAAAPLLEALGAGAIDAGYAGDAPTTFALAAGAEARIVSAIRSSPANTAILVPGGSTIRGVDDLRGRTIVTGRGSIGHYLVLAGLRSRGLRPDAVRLASLLPGDAKLAVQNGSADAWSTWSLYVAQATLRDGFRVVLDGRGLLSGLSYTTATTRAIADKPAELADFLGRIARARLWALDNLDRYAAYWARLQRQDPEVVRHLFATEASRPVPIDDGVVADQQATIDLWAGAGVIGRRLESRTLFDPRFNATVPA